MLFRFVPDLLKHCGVELFCGGACGVRGAVRPDFLELEEKARAGDGGGALADDQSDHCGPVSLCKVFVRDVFEQVCQAA